MSPHNRTVRLVVFDLDGTLIDSLGDLAEAVNRMLAGIAPGTPALSKDVVRGLVGKGARVLIERSLQEAGVTASTDVALARFLEGYRACLLDTTRLFPGVAEGLALLEDRTLAVLSNKPGEFSRAILAGLGVAERFVRVYGGDDLPVRKPDPAGLRRVMDELGVKPEETAMVGDSPIDVQTGRAAGAWTVGVTYGLDPDRLVRAAPDRLVSDLRELPDALR